MEIQNLLKKIEWLKSSHPYGSACIRIKNNFIIYIDPSHLSNEQVQTKADLILITHSHDDHFSIDIVSKLSKMETIVICTEDVKEILSESKPNLKILTLKPNESKIIADIKITAFPAYSISAHPRSSSWLGYVLEVDGHRIYHSGDSGLMEEMNALNDIDIAFLTIRHPYMMSSDQFIQALETIKPKIAVPLHWIEEERSDIDYIVENCPKYTDLHVLEMKNT
jgi:L-ascorbate metabolism protein UlaG (beta-lactamase superfamily)